MPLVILKSYLNANTSYKDYPDWAICLALGIVAFLVYILWKGKRTNNIKRKK